jgi:hypothetical protein
MLRKLLQFFEITRASRLLNTHEACFCESFESFGIHMKYVLRAFSSSQRTQEVCSSESFQSPKMHMKLVLLRVFQGFKHIKLTLLEAFSFQNTHEASICLNPAPKLRLHP